MKWLFILCALLLVGAIVTAVSLRFVGHDPQRWHVDPATVTAANPDNQSLQSEVFLAPPTQVAAVLQDILGDAPRVAGDLADGWATYVMTTRVMAYPDYVSIRLVPEGAGTRGVFFSRSRFGKLDMGVNRARIDDWMARIQAAISATS